MVTHGFDVTCVMHGNVITQIARSHDTCMFSTYGAKLATHESRWLTDDPFASGKHERSSTTQRSFACTKREENPVQLQQISVFDHLTFFIRKSKAQGYTYRKIYQHRSPKLSGFANSVRKLVKFVHVGARSCRKRWPVFMSVAFRPKWAWNEFVWMQKI